MDELNRRNFAGMLASLLGAVTLAATNAVGQATSTNAVAVLRLRGRRSS